MTSIQIQIKQAGYRLAITATTIDNEATPMEAELEYELRVIFANHLAKQRKRGVIFDPPNTESE